MTQFNWRVSVTTIYMYTTTYSDINSNFLLKTFWDIWMETWLETLKAAKNKMSPAIDSMTTAMMCIFMIYDSVMMQNCDRCLFQDTKLSLLDR